MIIIGDRVGFILANPPIFGDLRGMTGRSQGRQNLTITYADVLSINADGGLNLQVVTELGSFIMNGATQDESRQTPDCWFTLPNKSSQAPLSNHKIAVYYPGNGNTLGTHIGMVLTGNGTISHPALANTGRLASSRRTRFVSATTANAIGGVLSAHELCWRGTPRLGGFSFTARFAIIANPANSRAFIGLSASTTSLVAAEPSAAANTVGVGFDSTDLAAGNWQLILRDNATLTKIDLPLMPRNTTGFYELNIFSPSNGTNILIVKITNLNLDSVIYNNILTPASNIPQNSVFFRVHAAVGPAASASAAQLELSQLYLEMDL